MTQLRIVCLGWGSLVWNPDTLAAHLVGGWKTDGPRLPLEFARKSKNGRLTLVLVERAVPVPCLWSEMTHKELGPAVQALRRREGCPTDRIGVWPGSGAQPAYAQIDAWARDRTVDRVIWTALGPSFDESDAGPKTAEAAVHYLDTLTGYTRQLAEEYVRKAPAQVATAYRAAIETALGWTFDPTYPSPAPPPGISGH